MVGPLAMVSSGKPPGEYRTMISCSKKTLNHSAASSYSVGEGEGASGNSAAIGGNRESDGMEIRGIVGAD